MFIYLKKWPSSISERLTSQAGHENGSQEEDVLYETAIHLDMRRHLFLFFFFFIFCVVLVIPVEIRKRCWNLSLPI